MSSVRVTSGALEVVVDDDRARASTLLREAVKAIKDLPTPPLSVDGSAGFRAELSGSADEEDPSDQAKRPQMPQAGRAGFQVPAIPPPRP